MSSLSWLVDKIASFSSIIIIFFQGYRNRNNLMGRPSGSYNLCEKTQRSLIFGPSERFFFQFTKPFHEFELLSGASKL